MLKRFEAALRNHECLVGQLTEAPGNRHGLDQILPLPCPRQMLIDQVSPHFVDIGASIL